MFTEKTKKDRQEDIDVLMEMREQMLNDDEWWKYKRWIKAVLAGAMAIHRLNQIDFGEDER